MRDGDRGRDEVGKSSAAVFGGVRCGDGSRATMDEDGGRMNAESNGSSSVWTRLTSGRPGASSADAYE